MATASQQKAKQMSNNWLNLSRGEERQQNNYYDSTRNALIKDNDAQYREQFNDSWNWAERAAELKGIENQRDRGSREAQSITAASGQIGTAAAANYKDIVEASTWLADNPQEKRQQARFNAEADALANKAFGDGRGYSSGGGGFDPFGGLGGTSNQRQGDFGAIYGAPSQSYNHERQRDFDFQRSQAAQTKRMLSEADAAGDIKRDNSAAKNQRDMALLANRNEIDVMTRRASIDAQANSSQRSWQSVENQADRDLRSGEGDKDRANQRYLGQLQARTSMFNNLWDSYNPAKTNFAYWG